MDCAEVKCMSSVLMEYMEEVGTVQVMCVSAECKWSVCGVNMGVRAKCVLCVKAS